MKHPWKEENNNIIPFINDLIKKVHISSLHLQVIILKLFLIELLVGTYHTLSESAVQVMSLFKEFNPDSAVLELCDDRFFALNDAGTNEKT